MQNKIITCITPNETLAVMHELEAKGIFTSNSTMNRGTSPSSKEDIAIRVLTVMVDEERAETIFEFLYEKFNMHEAHNGLIYQQALKQSSEYRLPTEDELKSYK